jgi:protein SCO1/2
MSILRCLLLIALLALCPLQWAAAQAFPPQFRDIGIEQRLGAELPLDSEFVDQSGARVHLGDFFKGKPVLLIPVYYTCQTLCSEALRGLVEGISPLSLRPGRDFEIVAFSFNPAEGVEDARKKLDECTMNYAGRRGLPGWHFLIGRPEGIADLTHAIGFHYRYDSAHQMFIHASGMVIATPDARISRYLFGVTYQPRDLMNGISTAANQHISTGGAAMRLLCYPFASSTGRFNNMAMVLLRGASAATLLGLAAGLIGLWRYDRRRHRHDPSPGAVS